eukprot:UN31086
MWNYAPQWPYNPHMDREFNEDENVFLDDYIGREYKKAQFVAYTDDTFETEAEKNEEMGFLGPTIYGEVGDKIHVTFRNNAGIPYSMHPHGVKYEKESEGAPYKDGSDMTGDSIAPGETHVYEWEVTDRSISSHNKMSSQAWPYHSHVDSIQDGYSGLFGFIVITQKGMADEHGRPVDVDKEVFSLLSVTDENQSHYFVQNLQLFVMGGGDLQKIEMDPDDFEESNLMHGINGYLWNSGPIPQIKKGEKARWYLAALGTEVDMHTFHWHGNTLNNYDGKQLDVISLFPGQTETLDMVPDAVGQWMYHCHVNDHIAAGMIARYEVIEADNTETAYIPRGDGICINTETRRQPSNWSKDFHPDVVAEECPKACDMFDECLGYSTT